jgi:hypothetical protein
LARRDIGFQHPKLNLIIHSDFNSYTAIQDQLSNHSVCYWCLGTSQLQVKTEAEYHTITVDYAVAAAKAMIAANKNFSFHFISGRRADQTMKSSVLFARVKGEAEVELSKLGVPNLLIWRPGMILPLHPKIGSEATFTYKVGTTLGGALLSLFPGIGVGGVEVSKALFYATFNPTEKKLFENGDIKKLATL